MLENFQGLNHQHKNQLIISFQNFNGYLEDHFRIFLAINKIAIDQFSKKVMCLLKHV